VDAESFARRTGVSRETLDRLSIYGDELRRWNRAINLVAPRSVDELWQRHMLDSWQVLNAVGDGAGNWIDLGSGGGFPGLVVAASSGWSVTLVESDQRKSVFLRETARKMDVAVSVLTRRIEEVTDLKADVISARALAPLPRLLELAAPMVMDSTQCVFLKGQDVEAELTEATKCWTFDVEQHASLSDFRGFVLSIRKLTRHG